MPPSGASEAGSTAGCAAPLSLDPERTASPPITSQAQADAAALDDRRGAQSAEERADLALFHLIGRIGKALYPAKKTWVSTAYHVSVWLGIPRTARDGLHTWLRQSVASEPALAKLLRRLVVRCDSQPTPVPHLPAAELTNVAIISVIAGTSYAGVRKVYHVIIVEFCAV